MGKTIKESNGLLGFLGVLLGGKNNFSPSVPMKREVKKTYNIAPHFDFTKANNDIAYLVCKIVKTKINKGIKI